MEPLNTFLDLINSSLLENTFAKISLGDYRGEIPELKKLIAKRIVIKNKEQLSFVYRYQTKDITKNYSLTFALDELNNLIGRNEFCYAHLCTTVADTKLQRTKKGDFILKKEPATIKEKPLLAHDKKKERKITAGGKAYLNDLGITDAEGKVRNVGQDKFKQINHYIEILSSLLKDLSARENIEIVDMGSGKGYLTFALYDYVVNTLGRKATITGVEFRKDLVNLCNEIATKSSFTNLHFVENTIQEYKPTRQINVLIALHACDTATDDAIYKGIQNNADLIVVAPCCHKQIRREMNKNKSLNDLDFLLKHGIFIERQAEMVTDGLRALLLESVGYTTKIFEFIATEHTPKNVLIVAQKKENKHINKEAILNKIEDAKNEFGIQQHHLELLLNNN